MSREPTGMPAALTPRATIHAYLSYVAEQRRRDGVVPWNGRWIGFDNRIAALKAARRSSWVILLELIVLFLLLTGVAAALLLLTWLLAY
ncbi:MAG TPA: hypothetical protein VHA35_25695 [Dongiaceae bacterium]|nr:hypothetical protein [Dongiaceae bacterium]